MHNIRAVRQVLAWYLIMLNQITAHRVSVGAHSYSNGLIQPFMWDFIEEPLKENFISTGLSITYSWLNHSLNLHMWIHPMQGPNVAQTDPHAYLQGWGLNCLTDTILQACEKNPAYLVIL